MVFPPGGLYFSAVLRPDFDLDRYPLIGYAMALAISDVLGDLGIEAKIKWPNDLLVHGKKIAGILAEAKVYVILGVGVNVNIARFPNYLESATSVSIEVGKEVGPKWLLELIMDRFWNFYGMVSTEGGPWELVDLIKSRSSLIGKVVEVDLGGDFAAGVADIDEMGRLVITGDGGSRVIEAGDVTKVTKVTKVKEFRD